MTLGSLAVVAGLVGLILLYRRERVRERERRARFFDGCLDLFQTYRVVQEHGGYPVLTGTYRGNDVRLEPVVDDMACRKVPILWLKISVLRPIPYRGALDFLMRPLGTEFYSPSAQLDHDMEVPEAWPQNAILRTDLPDSMPPIELLTPHVEKFSDTNRKELVVTPKGVRLVCQVWQASRAHYRVLREVRFDEETLRPEFVEKYLEAAVAVARSLCDKAPLRQVA